MEEAEMQPVSLMIRLMLLQIKMVIFIQLKLAIAEFKNSAMTESLLHPGETQQTYMIRVV